MSIKRKYYLAFKLRTINKAETHENRNIVATLGIDEKRIREWRQKKETIQHQIEEERSSKQYRLAGGGRKVTHPEVDEQLCQQILIKREKHIQVSYKDLCQEAKRLIPNEEFHASRGWIEKFMDHNKFSFRRNTTMGQRLPPDLIPKVERFIKFNANQIMNFKLTLPCIGNMDETAIWSDMPGFRTLAPTGVKSVPVLTTGHEKQWTTVALTALADGTKLPPYVIFKDNSLN